MTKKRKYKRKSWKSFSTVVDEAKQILADKNVTFQEIEDNTGVDAEFARILFDDSTRAHQNITAIFDFLHIRFISKRLLFAPYSIFEKGNQIRIRRVIKPKCTLYYDRQKDEFFKFSYDLKNEHRSKLYTDITKNDMKDMVYSYLEEKNEKKQ